MTDTKRRLLLKGSGAMALSASAGLLTPATVLANWPQAAFKAQDQAQALKDLLGTETFETTDAIKIKAPDIAENGAVVPVTVSTDLDGVQSITIFAAGNHTPLIASFELADNALPFVSTRIKMAETADVIAVVKTDAGLFGNTKRVKVTIGGCSG